MTYMVSEDTNNIRKMVSTYITECGSKGPASQPASLSVSLSVLDRQTDFSQPVSLSLTDRLT